MLFVFINILFIEWKNWNHEWLHKFGVRQHEFPNLIRYVPFQILSIFKCRGNTMEIHFPICVDDLLDKQGYNFANWARKHSNMEILPISKKIYGSSCRLLNYTNKHAVNCIDVLHQKIVPKTKRSSRLHLVFMGDSRIRQQFYNFLKASILFEIKFFSHQM